MPAPDVIPFVGGDDLIEDIVIRGSDGAIADLTGATVSGLVRAANRPDMPLALGAEIEIADALPEDGEPHGFVRLSRVQTAALPVGPASTMRLSVEFPGTLRNSTYDFVLERIR